PSDCIAAPNPTIARRPQRWQAMSTTHRVPRGASIRGSAPLVRRGRLAAVVSPVAVGVALSLVSAAPAGAAPRSAGSSSTIGVGGGPIAVATDAGNHRTYVVNYNDNTVS